MRTEPEKVEELLLAWMYPVLEHRSYSLLVRIQFLEQMLRLEITYHPSRSDQESQRQNTKKNNTPHQ
jgi:hypothetical protein